MHSGFSALRTALPQNLRARIPLAPSSLSPEVTQDIERVCALWTDCRTRFGQGGPFLFGAFTIADAMYAPVVGRFRTYGIPLSGILSEYAAAIGNLPGMRAWDAAAMAEPWHVDKYERRP